MAERKESRELTLNEKVDLLRFLEANSQRKTAERFLVSKTTVSNIQKRKREYLERYDEENGDVRRKRRMTSLEQVNDAALSWFKQMRAINARISGPMIQEAAKRFAQELGLEGFQASSGWLEKFKLRHKISQKILCGESNEVPVEVVEDFITKFRHFASGFREEDIFNADECGLFFKAMPDRSLVLKGDKCKSGKLSKERFTVLLCASATGEKLKPLVIGRSAKPRAFRNPRPDDLPVTWRSNRCAWMTAGIFEEWLSSVDRQMKRMKRSILVVVDNCPSHPRLTHLTNVTLKFLPPNTSSRTQPLDQGVIKTFKANYRTQLLQWVISKAGVGGPSVGAPSIAGSVTALDAVLWINSSWDKVQPEGIRKCWRRAGFVKDQEDAVEAQSDSPSRPAEAEDADFEDFIAIDDEVATCTEPDPQAIFQSVLAEAGMTAEASNAGDDTEEETDDETETVQKLKEENARNMLVQLRCFAADKCPEMLSGVASAEAALAAHVCRKSKHQTRIDTFFKKHSGP